MNPNVRPANSDDLDAIFLMGFEAWSDGNSKNDYLDECRSSSKYKRGSWFVFEENGNLLSSLITYHFKADTFGIGSIATPRLNRNKGHASKLIFEVLKRFDQSSKTVRIFLYSDIKPEFYEKFGFKRLPEVAQRYQTTTCMVRGANPKEFISTDQVPEYF